jgi:membrane protein YqaA with SNARE-associated domain
MLVAQLSPQAQERVRSAVFGLLIVTTAASLLGTALSPYLLVKSPLLLVAMSPAAHHVALAAASVEPLPLIAVASLRRVLTGLGAYGLGYFYGRSAIGWLEERYPRLAGLITRIERLLARFGVWVLVIAPAPVVAVLAGAARPRVVPFTLALALGHLAWNTATYFLGEAFARWTDLLTGYMGENLLESTLVCIGLLLLQQAIAALLRRRRQRRVV